VAGPTQLSWLGSRRLLSYILRDPDAATLRWSLLLSAATQMILAPLTSWAGDTPNFILSAISLLYRGNPYALSSLFNPPLASYLQAPLFAIIVLFEPPQSLIPTHTILIPWAAATGLSAQIPVPVALLAVKFPLILGALAGGALIHWSLRDTGVEPRTRNVLVVVWLLNPLVIWATAVHAETDVLAATLLLLFLFLLQRGLPLAAGVALGLAFFAKGYPLFVVPVAISFLLLNEETGLVGARLRQLARFGAGLALSTIPFLDLLPTLEQYFLGLVPASRFGGLSILALFRPWYPGTGASLLGKVPPSTMAGVHSALFLMFVASIAVSPLFLLRRRSLESGSGATPRMGFLWIATLFCATAAILSYGSPQSENLLGMLALLILCIPMLGRPGWILLGTLTGSGFALYMALASPVAYFLPAAALLGRAQLLGAANFVSAYEFNTVFPRAQIWILLGTVGGVSILVLWTICITVAAGWRQASTQGKGGGSTQNAD
jgi:hypothetical protein